MYRSIFLLGPTCVGKSGVAINLARKIHAEIVSCDSMQVYRGMDIGTAKPSKSEQKLIPHHMISVVNLTQEYNVAKYAEAANEVIADITKRNKTPLIAGGTGLYLRALTDGLFSGPSSDPEIRSKLEDRAKEEGLQSLYNELERRDPAGASKIKPQDKRRIIRALEVYYLTGKPISSFQTQWRPLTRAPHVLSPKGRGNYLDHPIIGLNRNREDLYSRINERVDKMFEDGFVGEVKALAGKGLRENKTARQALGYKEILNYMDGKYSLDETKELVKRNTRRFAKRQLTWFRRDDRVKWILVETKDDMDDIVERIRERLTSFKL